MKISKKIKTKSLEKKRTSILTDDLTTCIECGRPKQHIHEIYYGKNRRTSMLYGFCIPLCFECHNEIHSNIELDMKYKKLCQIEYETDHTRDDFIKLIGRNYLN